MPVRIDHVSKKCYHQKVKQGNKWINRTVYNVSQDSNKIIGSVTIGSDIVSVELRSVFGGIGCWFPIADN